ncbi:MAG: ABC transporter substrate-binding protein [Polyangiaceae bacterium]
MSVKTNIGRGFAAARQRAAGAGRLWLLGLVVLVFVGGDAACRRSATAEPRVTIGYFANLTHAQAVLGVASGDFERAVAPLKLETKLFNAGPSLIEALFAGEIDIGYVGPGPALSAYERSAGKGIVVVGGAAANGVVIVARKGSGITTLADLAGKRVATPQLGNTQDISARHYLASVLKQTDLRSVMPVDNAEQAAMFNRGDVDAAWVPEPWGQRLVTETGATLVAEEKDLWPDKQFLLTLVVTTPEFLAKKPDVVKAVLKAHRAWTARLTSEPAAHVAELGDALFTLTGKRLPPGVLPVAIARVRFVDDPGLSTLRTFATWKHDLGLERGGGSLDTQALVDPTAMERASAP